MNCPHCGQPLRDGATFCSHCGKPVTTSPVPPRPSTSAPRQAAPLSSAPASQNDYVGQLGATGYTVSIWGPFAGYGTRREHLAWLLGGLGSRAEELRDTITEIFDRRQIPGAEINLVTLTGKGLAIEKRTFYRIRRGLAVVWLYVARFGQDLYVSQVSYIKGQISVLRLAIAGLLLLISGIFMLNALAAFLNIQSVISSFNPLTGGGTKPNEFLINSLCCCTGPLGSLSSLALLVGAIYSVYKFLTEKDILALFREPLNEFQEDDIVSLEKAVNETVRQAADIIGIDSKLFSLALGRRSDHRVI